MKYRFWVLIWTLGAVSSLRAYDFKAVNADNIDLYYSIKSENSVYVTCETKDNNNYKLFKGDILRIPEFVTSGGHQYSVEGIETDAFNYFPGKCALWIPNTIAEIESQTSNQNPFTKSKFSEYIVAEDNAFYKSVDGVLYNKTGRLLLSYPPQKKDRKILFPEGIDTLAKYAFYEAEHLQYIEFPLSLKVLLSTCLASADSVETIILQDSVTTIENLAIDCMRLKSLVMGTSTEKLHPSFVVAEYAPISMTCRAAVPPSLKLGSSFNYIDTNSTLLVPRKSIDLYRAADGWKEFGTIIPIEPPITVGKDSADIYWIQNFSATGYVWKLYTDEERTQLFMSLSFDINGNLLQINLGNHQAPRTMPAFKQEDSQEKRYAEYYSFVITGLMPGTTYYYTRTSMTGTDVIDEEKGFFKTKADSAAAVDTENTGNPQCAKFVHNGQIFILRGDKTFTIQGQEVTLIQ